MKFFSIGRSWDFRSINQKSLLNYVEKKKTETQHSQSNQVHQANKFRFLHRKQGTLLLSYYISGYLYNLHFLCLSNYPLSKFFFLSNAGLY